MKNACVIFEVCQALFCFFSSCSLMLSSGKGQHTQMHPSKIVIIHHHHHHHCHWGASSMLDGWNIEGPLWKGPSQINVPGENHQVSGKEQQCVSPLLTAKNVAIYFQNPLWHHRGQILQEGAGQQSTIGGVDRTVTHLCADFQSCARWKKYKSEAQLSVFTVHLFFF